MTLTVPLAVTGSTFELTTSFRLPYVAWGMKDPSTLPPRGEDAHRAPRERERVAPERLRRVHFGDAPLDGRDESVDLLRGDEERRRDLQHHQLVAADLRQSSRGCQRRA